MAAYSAMAQQSSQSDSQSAEAKAKASSGASSAPDYFRINRSDNPMSPPTPQIVRPDAIEVEAPIYVKDGRVYIGLGLPAILVPMTGGGECFSADLKARMELLKNLIVRLPR